MKILLGSIAAFLLSNSSVCEAANLLTYDITATHTNAQGVTTPFLDKEMSFEVSFRRGSDLAISHSVSANTDKNGKATLKVNSDHLGFAYAGIDLFCAKLDGPHYCNGVFATTNNSLNPTDDPSQVLYNCEYSVVEAQTPHNPGSITISCTDQ